jgi:SAM-dependent methyltransferase
MRTIASIYDANPEGEWHRLEAPYQSLEFKVTMDRLERYLPKSGRVLDAGGGPGRYAIELCRRGYQVVLLDISRGCLDFAGERFGAESNEVRERLEDAVVGDVRDLSPFEDCSFDVVLCLDPLSYLPELAERSKALDELLRVTKVGGLVCIAVRGYLAVVRQLVRHFPSELADPSIDDLLWTGNTSVGGVPVHFFRADEIRNFAEANGLVTLEMSGCEGLSSGLKEETNTLAENDVAWKRWVDLVLRTASDPSIVDHADHILYLGRRPV